VKYFVPKRAVAKTSSWQIIYMDLMTIIMVFFVILWSINKGKDEGVSDTVGDVTTRAIDLPSDILFEAGKALIKGEGKSIFQQLFSDETGAVLDFATAGVVKRMLVIHGHTDQDGKKLENFSLGFERAFSAFSEIKKYSQQLPDHVVLCSHADNSPAILVPTLTGKISQSQRSALREAKGKNRRITIEDVLVNNFKED
jgi:hypothetical protein